MEYGSSKWEIRNQSQSCKLTVEIVKSGQQMDYDDLDTWIRAQTHFDLMHNESVSARQDIFCPCSTDFLDKIRNNTCQIHQLIYQTMNVPKVTLAPNEDVPKEQVGRGPTHLASGALVFISLLMKYI